MRDQPGVQVIATESEAEGLMRDCRRDGVILHSPALSVKGIPTGKSCWSCTNMNESGILSTRARSSGRRAM